MEENVKLTKIMEYVDGISPEFPEDVLASINEDPELKEVISGFLLTRYCAGGVSPNPRMDRVLDAAEKVMTQHIQLDEDFGAAYKRRTGAALEPEAADAANEREPRVVDAAGRAARPPEQERPGWLAWLLRPAVWLPVSGMAAAGIALAVYVSGNDATRDAGKKPEVAPVASGSSSAVSQEEFLKALRDGKQQQVVLAGMGDPSPPMMLDPGSMGGLAERLAFLDTQEESHSMAALDGSKFGREQLAFRSGWQWAILFSGAWNSPDQQGRGKLLAKHIKATVRALGLETKLSELDGNFELALASQQPDIDLLARTIRSEGVYTKTNRLLVAELTGYETVALMVGRLYVDLILADLASAAADETAQQLKGLLETLKAGGSESSLLPSLQTVVDNLDSGNRSAAVQAALDELGRK